MILSIAWKNIWRNKLRSSIVIVALSIGIWSATVTAALIEGFKVQRIKSAVEKEVSHVQIHNPRYLENNEIQYVIANASQVADSVGRIANVLACSERSKIQGMICSANSSTGILVIGIDPLKERKVTTLFQNIRPGNGSYFEGVKKSPILISEKLAAKLKIKLRSKIIVRFQNSDGNICEGAFKVCGIYKTSNAIFDEVNVFVRSSDLTKLTGGAVGVHEIALMFKDEVDIKTATSYIEKLFPKLDVKIWYEIQPELGILNDMTDIKTYFILAIILFALSFGIVNTMLMVVMERRRELAMLMAIGMRKGRVFTMIIIETVMLSLTGGVGGILLSGVFIYIFKDIGFDLSGGTGSYEQFGLESVVYPIITLSFFINLVVLIVVTGVISSISPAIKAMKINIIRALAIEL